MPYIMIIHLRYFCQILEDYVRVDAKRLADLMSFLLTDPALMCSVISYLLSAFALGILPIESLVSHDW